MNKRIILITIILLSVTFASANTDPEPTKQSNSVELKGSKEFNTKMNTVLVALKGRKSVSKQVAAGGNNLCFYSTPFVGYISVYEKNGYYYVSIQSESISQITLLPGGFMEASAMCASVNQ